jgi:hypothetical protein
LICGAPRQTGSTHCQNHQNKKTIRCKKCGGYSGGESFCEDCSFNRLIETEDNPKLYNRSPSAVDCPPGTIEAARFHAKRNKVGAQREVVCKRIEPELTGEERRRYEAVRALVVPAGCGCDD